MTASASEIGGDSVIAIGPTKRPHPKTSHRVALEGLPEGLPAEGIALSEMGVVAHRGVHVGETMVESCLATPEVRGAGAARAAP
ncbi:MAG: hypothetical protein AAF577_07805 [Pseudomonadota bacterium]